MIKMNRDTKIKFLRVDELDEYDIVQLEAYDDGFIVEFYIDNTLVLDKDKVAKNIGECLNDLQNKILSLNAEIK